MSIKSIFSQDSAIDALQRAYGAERLPHALVFAGRDGIGRYKTAHELAKMLLCGGREEEKSDDGVFYDSCGGCKSCKLMEAGSHPDFIDVYKELLPYTKEGRGKAPPIQFPKDVIDEFLIETVSSRPDMGPWKVYVVHEAEKLNKSSQNTLLKVLEEPPGYCLLILLCSRPEKLVPTIHSRCQTIRFGPVDRNIIIEKLSENGIGTQEAAFWAGFSQGSLGEAAYWSRLTDEKELSCYKIKTELVDIVGRFNLTEAVNTAEWMQKNVKIIADALTKQYPQVSNKDLKRRAQKLMMGLFLSVFTDAARLLSGSGDEPANSDQLKIIEKTASEYGLENCLDIIDKVYENMRWIDENVHEGLNFEEMLLSAAGCGIM